MIGAVGLLQLSALAALGFALVAAAASSLLYPAVSGRVARLQASTRARVLVIWAALPLLAGFFLVAICFLPPLAGALGVASDHCLTHDDHHGHLCFVHQPRTAGSLVGWLVLAGCGAWVALAVGGHLRRLHEARRLVRSLRAGSRPTAGGIRLVESPTPLSVTAGVLRPEIYVSSGLVSSVPAEVLAVVVEHERSHVARRDGARKLLARLVSLAHLPGTRRRLLADLGLACEQACDEDAALRIGDRLLVAEAIIAMERRLSKGQDGLGALASAFGGNDVAPRVQALLAVPSPEHRRSRVVLWVAVLAVALVVADPLHHLTETILGMLAR